MAAWHSTVHSMRVAIGAWLSKASKHAMVAFPLLTQLLCLDSENAFMQGVAPLLDGLQKQLKVWCPPCHPHIPQHLAFGNEVDMSHFKPHYC